MTHRRVPHRSRRCLTCGYTLDGLSGKRCPECGREFDAIDPRTFRWDPPIDKDHARTKNGWIVSLVYAAPQIVSLVFWMRHAMNPSVALPWGGVVRWASLGTGPFAGLVNESGNPWGVVLLFVAIWACLIALLLRTRMRNVAYLVHAVLSLLWLVSGYWAGLVSGYFVT